MPKWLADGKHSHFFQQTVIGHHAFAQNLRLLHAIGNDTESDDGKRTKLALRLVLENFRLDQAYLGVVDESTMEFVMQTVVARNDEPTYGPGKRYHLARTLLGHVVDANAVFAAPDVVKTRAQYRIDHTDEWKSFIAMPIRLNGQRYGAIGFKGRVARQQPFSTLDAEFVAVTGELIAATVHRQIQRNQLDSLAFTDSLTGLPNRMYFSDRLSNLIAASAGTNAAFCVTFIDLDGFKLVNDSFGHAAGDTVLREFAHRLANTVRAGDIVARLGGDEFVILMPDLPWREDAQEIAARIVRNACAGITIDGRAIRLGASVGVSLFPDDGGDAQTILAHADAKMFEMKRLAAALRCQ